MREKIFILLLILGFGILVSRLFVLQVVQGAYWREISEGNRIKVEKLPSLRGVIYDRNQTLLVRNTPNGREYIYGSQLAHVLGYVGEVSQEEIGQNTDESLYKPGDIVGKMGLEKQYDQILRGIDGGILEEVDANGQRKRLLGNNEAISGKSLNLTLDLGLQKKANEVLQDKKGAVIVLDPKTGGVLALVSTPSFDPNIFTLMENKKTNSQKIKEIIDDKNQPLFNRAIAGLYPPASTFKLVSAIAGFEEGKIDQKTQVEDKGQISAGGLTFGNWYFKQYGGTEGWVDVVKALKRSNDIFFYRVGEWLGIEKLAMWARKMGFGKPEGIDLPSEAAGLVPDKIWKKENRNENWYLGDDFNTAIGQGNLLATPLQIGAMTQIVANNGEWCRPHLNKNQELEISDKCKDILVDKDNIDLVKEGMRQACDTGGTGWPLFNFKVKSSDGSIKVDDVDFFGPSASDSADTVYIPVACKTSSAEAPGKNANSHAWFTVFAPINDPQIVVTVLVENGGEGSSVAGPLARDILKYWFESQ